MAEDFPEELSEGDCELRPLRRRSVGPMFRELFRKSLFTLRTVFAGESALTAPVGGRLFGPFSDLLEDLLNAVFFTESLLVRLFLLSDLVRFLIELLLVKEEDVVLLGTPEDASDLLDTVSAGESVLLLFTATFFLYSGDQGDVVALLEVGLNLEYFVGSSIRSDWISLSTISGFFKGRSMVFGTVLEMSNRRVLLGVVEAGLGDVALWMTFTCTIITSSSSTFNTRSMSSAKCLISSRVCSTVVGVKGSFDLDREYLLDDAASLLVMYESSKFEDPPPLVGRWFSGDTAFLNRLV